MTLISIVTSCLNEADNVAELHQRIKAQFAPGGPAADFEFEHLYVDNGSTDDTVARVKALAAADPRVKLIVNARNFGHVRSPLHGMYQASGQAVICMASDLQDPPELIGQFVADDLEAILAGQPPQRCQRADVNTVTKLRSIPVGAWSTGATPKP